MAEAHLEARRGWVVHGANRWVDYFKFNTDHKVIGTQYIAVGFVFFLIAGMMAEMIRTQLMRPDNTLFTGNTFNELFSLHGTIMIFLWIIPVLIGVGNYIVPLQIGANDMAFPKLNALSLWLTVISGIVMIASIVVGGAASGWSAYPPLSEQTGFGQTLWAIALLVTGFASIFGALNFMVTIFTMRAPGMGLFQMPLFVWSIVATALMILAGTPVLAGALALLLWDRLGGAIFFSANSDPLMWQNLFWFYSHPAVYIMILPGFGIISEVLAVNARKPIFGYRAIAFSSAGIAVLG
ncbi:MAG TPA: cbb3-type cytochrome c oxidase subunit I, partial [Anaerolineae bacterium]